MIDFNKYSEIKKSEIQNLIKNIKNNWKEKINKHEAYKKILSLIDLTTLEGSDTEKKIISLCNKAKGYKLKGKGIPNVAAVCVYPPFVKIAKKNLEDTGIKVASVAGAFPSGQSPLFVKIEEVKYAINEGADEIDMVISRGKFLEGNYQEVFDEISAIKDVCGDKHLKVILETGELESLKNIRKASEIAINAGADFIKTSTGKISPAATEPAFIVMLDTIKEYYEKTEKMIGVKPAGGISEPWQALNYLVLVKDILGDKWLNKNYFRIGASRLADKILTEILKTE
ncbi:MAG: deoxyribose-phosphate aldolase [Bacteroidales bacterium]|nr:deoxyribose-phosphate aldolase [Bacteroidales bacterium]